MSKELVEWRKRHRGKSVPCVGFDVICARCTGGYQIYVPATEFDLAYLEEQIGEKMVKTPTGWVCRAHIGADLLPLQSQEILSPTEVEW